MREEETEEEEITFIAKEKKNVENQRKHTFVDVINLIYRKVFTYIGFSFYLISSEGERKAGNQVTV